MKQFLLWIVNICSLVACLFFGTRWLNLLGLEYNSEGRYFDQDNAVVYHEDSLVGYGILCLATFLVFAFSSTVTWKLIRKNSV